jgi:drug/metabolite transporter (DMT)-like permease
MHTPLSKKKRARAILLTLIAGVLWGTSFPAIKIGLNYIDTYLFVFLRFLLASVMMFVIMIATGKLVAPAKQKTLILFLGITNGIGYLLQYVGMSYTSAAKAALFVNLNFIWVALLGVKLQGESIGKTKTVGVIAALTGIILVTTNLNFSLLAEGQLLGDILLIASGIVWALFTIYNKNLVMTSKGVLQSLTWILPLTLLPMLPFVFSSAQQISSISAQAWLVIIYTAVVCWIIPYYLWLEGLKHITASTSTIILLSEIIVAITISSVFLNEILTLVSLTGSLLIIAAILLVSITKSKPLEKRRIRRPVNFSSR